MSETLVEGDERMRLDRAEGALLGLAGADAASFPAMYHRTLQLPRRRSRLWSHAQNGDLSLVNKFPLPFVLSDPVAALAFGPTDDAEQAALASQVVLAVGDDPSIEELFTEWWRRVEPQQDAFWGSVADRSAVLNARMGLRAPVTGNDNPHHFDDSALARVVPVAIRWAGQPHVAARVARRLASITNADVGIDGAASFAAALSEIVGGGTVAVAVDLARAEVGADSWISRRWAAAETIFDECGGLFAAIPRWNDEIVNAEYNFGNVVAETLPLAMLIARESRSYAEALGIAALVPKQADTMPAMVGALIGGSLGASALPPTWCAPLEMLLGICVPSTKGLRLRDLAAALLASGRPPTQTSAT